MYLCIKNLVIIQIYGLYFFSNGMQTSCKPASKSFCRMFISNCLIGDINSHITKGKVISSIRDEQKIMLFGLFSLTMR